MLPFATLGQPMPAMAELAPSSLTLALDFLGQEYRFNADGSGLAESSFASLITCARASAAYVTNPSGQLELISANQPRFDHDASGALGLLTEPASTNLFLHSSAFDNAAWSRVGLLAFGSGSSANSGAAPDGSTTADLLVETTGSGNHQIVQTISKAAAATTYTVSIYARASNGDRNLGIECFSGGFAGGINSSFQLSGDGALGFSPITYGAGFTVQGAEIHRTGSNDYRCALSFTTDAGTALNIRFKLNNDAVSSYTGNGSSGLYLWGAQLEALPAATSYIPTTSSAAARAADNYTLAVSEWFNPSRGTFLIDSLAVTRQANSTPWPFSLDDGSSEEALGLLIDRNAATLSAGFRAEDALTEVFDLPLPPDGTVKVGLTYTAAACAISLNGSPTQENTDSLALPAGLATMRLANGPAAGNAFQGHIRAVQYWGKNLSGEVLRQLSNTD
jgi:hypothetical protein